MEYSSSKPGLKDSSTSVPTGNSNVAGGSKEVKGKTHTYYQVSLKKGPKKQQTSAKLMRNFYLKQESAQLKISKTILGSSRCSR